jgi:energy-converting hydrogenase Eha subunit H
MRGGFPESVVWLLTVAFAASLLALLAWLACFVSDAAFLGRPGALGGLRLTAVLSGSVALFSGLLAFHFRYEDYTRGEDVYGTAPV